MDSKHAAFEMHENHPHVAEAKLRKYKLNEADADEAVGLAAAAVTTTAAAAASYKPPPQSTKYKLENLFDFKLKFDSPSLERFYKKSYLPITRFLFSLYLIYIIILLISWIVYFVVDDNNATKKFEGELFQYSQRDANTSVYSVKNQIYYFNDGDSENSHLYLAVYMTVLVVLLVVVLIYLLIDGLKESKHKRLEQQLRRSEAEKHVNSKMAEDDLKKAIKDVLEKESEYLELSEKLNASYAQVSKSREFYSKLANPVALLVVALLFGMCFMGFVWPPSSLTPFTHFVWFCQVTLLLYLVYPFQMFIPVVFGVMFSVLFEMLSIKRQLNELESLTTTPSEQPGGWTSSHYSQAEIVMFVLIKCLLHVSVHSIGVYLKLSKQAIKRDTFLKVANMHKAHMESAKDREMTERMIKSIMPPLFTPVFGKPEDFKRCASNEHQMRPLFIYPVKQLSILFADIVGFTRMSSSKSAEELVFLLNDLYGRFDKLCELTNCEKISTLGDCYYCVSGCLNGRADHARCCVEMGLKMIKEIEQFNKMHNVDVNMRVGVHTGNALCGFIGGKRFRFDVWSSDVTLANKMESSGKPGLVHISQDTYEALGECAYKTEAGHVYLGKQTYFIMNEVDKKTVAEVLKENASLEKQQTLQEEAAAVDDEILPIGNTTVGKEEDDAKLLAMTLKNGDFFEPDYNLLTMRFQPDEEKKYQSYLLGMQSAITYSASLNIFDKNVGQQLWVNPRNLLFVSIAVSFVVNLCISTGYLLTFLVASHASCVYEQSSAFKTNLIVVAVLFAILFGLQLIFMIFYLLKCSDLIRSNKRRTFFFDKFLSKQVHFSKAEREVEGRFIAFRYRMLHLVSLTLMCLMPAFIVATAIPVMKNLFDYSLTPISGSAFTADDLATCEDYTNSFVPRVLNLYAMYSYFLFVVGIIHFSLYVQLSSLVKTICAFLLSLLFGLIGFIGVYPHFDLKEIVSPDLITSLESQFINGSYSTEEFQNVTIISFSLYTNLFLQGFMKENVFILLDLTLLVLLVWLINRQAEFVHRLGFKCDQNAQLKVTYAKEQKELANWLIEVVLPSHVVNHVQQKKQYSKNYDCIGVLFLSLCNFGEFFEETYEGGRNLLRVLNEISVDFDRLFDEPKYANVEKIKSIGSTFMIASGLRPTSENQDKNDKSHLYDLIDFALELNKKLEDFNKDAMSVCHFTFKIRMGFHCGPVTAGVIGTERLLYDVWGDTVNVASRMDSTGQAGYMQTTEEATRILDDKYSFVYRGPVNIKGKDNMITYFMDPTQNTKVNDALD